MASQAIKQDWKKLRSSDVNLGDYPTPAARESLWSDCPDAPKAEFDRFPGGLLTFQKGNRLLGAVHYQHGQLGTWFFEPVPLEPQGEEEVGDQLYVQYALMKFFEAPLSRKMVVVRAGYPLRLLSEEDTAFFTVQGFTTRPMVSWHRARAPWRP